MRARSVCAVVGLPGLTLAVLVACGDIFHSTDFATLCTVDAAAPGCAHDGAPPPDSPPPITNFCNWSSSEARSHAAYACAWLSACELPLGNNAFGPCMVQAILAYDCGTNPNRPVIGDLHAFWDRLWQAKSCNDVSAVVFPGTIQLCEMGGPSPGCGGQTPYGDNTATRVECDATEAGALGESCLMQGRRCGVNYNCNVADDSDACTSGCAGTVLHDCEDAGDLGTDCRYFGAGSCTTGAGLPACAPTNAGAPCTPSQGATCDDAGGAHRCATGFEEIVNCGGLGGVCIPGPLIPMWDTSAACAGEAGNTDAGADEAGDAEAGDAQGGGCSASACQDGDTLFGCIRGLTFTTSCMAAHVGPCGPVNTLDGLGAACGHP